MTHSNAYDAGKIELHNRRDAGVALEHLVTAAAAAERALAVWGDGVRAVVERQLNIGVDDPRAWNDPIYAATLDLYGHVRRTRARIENEMKAFQQLTSGDPEFEAIDAAIMEAVDAGLIEVSDAT